MKRMFLACLTLVLIAAVMGAAALTTPSSTAQMTGARPSAGIDTFALTRSAPRDLPVEIYPMH